MAGDVRYDHKDFPRRTTARRDENDKYVRYFLQQICRLSEETSPSRGKESAEGKDSKAREALRYAGDLVTAIAGWAIDHQMGLAIEGLPFFEMHPYFYEESRKHYDRYRKELAKVDDHRHEKIGGIPRKIGELDRSILRNMLINLLRPNPGGFDFSLISVFIEAMESLDFGEVLPLLRQTTTKRKVKLRELKIQLKAIEFVAYRRGLGSSKEKAEAAVAKVFKVSTDTLGSWEDRLSDSKAFGAVKVAMFKAAARKRGSDVKDADKNLFHGVDVSPWIQRYGDDTMREIAKQRKKREPPKKR
jgi:hypothetical protein